MEIKEEIKVINLLPKEWFNSKGECGVYTSVYHCLTDILIREKKVYLTGRVFNTVFLIVNTEIMYPSLDVTYNSIKNSIPQFNYNVQEKKSESDVFLILMSKYSSPEAEFDVLMELQSARGLITTVEGRNATFVHLTNYVLNFPSEQMTTVSPIFQAPEQHSAFDGKMDVGDISRRIDSLDSKLSSRIKLALRWVDSAEHEIQTLDKFLKLWFAIETISMPDTTNIKPLIAQLATIYQIDAPTAQSTFKVGAIFGLRSNIVHNGLITPIHFKLNDYLKAIFQDILFDHCRLTSRQFANQVLLDPTFKTVDWMP